MAKKKFMGWHGQEVGALIDAYNAVLLPDGIPPRGNVTAQIIGWIFDDTDLHYRSISIPGTGKSVDTAAFNQAMAEGDTRAAYQVLFNAYAPGLMCAQADHLELHYHEEQ